MGAKPGPSAPAPLLTAAPGGSPNGFWKGTLPGSRELGVGEDLQPLGLGRPRGGLGTCPEEENLQGRQLGALVAMQG